MDIKKPKQFKRPSERLTKDDIKMRRKGYFPHDNVFKQYTQNPELKNYEITDIHSHMRPRSRPPTPTLEEPLPSITYRAEKTSPITSFNNNRDFSS